MPNKEPEVLTGADTTFCISGGRIVDPSSGRDEIGDLWVAQGKIVDGPDDANGASAIIEAEGLVVTPGLIDARVHLREPGFEYQETIVSGARAAAAGGFTGVVCMPNTNPVADNAEVVRYILEQARPADARVHPVGAATKGTQGEQLSEVGDMVAAGIVAISDGTHTITDAGIMRRSLEYASMFSIPVISHCVDEALALNGLMNEGYISTLMGLKGIPNAAEEIVIARDIMLAELSGCRLHIAHISTAGGVALVREAKRRGIPVTTEVTPYHCFLTDEAVRSYNPNMKLRPPLRSTDDVAAIREGLADGTIDTIVSNHTPYSIDEKTVEFDAAPFGTIGLETTLGLVMTELVHTDMLNLNDAIRLMSVNPAGIFGLNAGTLQVGAPADITVFDPDREWTVAAKEFYSISRNSAVDGRVLRGRAVLTIVDGRTMQWQAA